jgi:transcription antitermination factor NusG
MERYCSTGQSPQRAVVPTEEEEEEEKEEVPSTAATSTNVRELKNQKMIRNKFTHYIFINVQLRQ